MNCNTTHYRANSSSVPGDPTFTEHADVAHLIVTFLALLELAREELVSIAQTEPYAPIHVTLTAAPTFTLASDET